VTAPRLTRLIGPTCGCEKETAQLAVRLREPHVIDAAIVNADGDRVRTLATDVRRPRGRVRFTWDGRDDAGAVVPDGLYRLGIHLDREDRTIVVPTPIRVDTTPPRVRLVSARPRVVSPDGDGRADRVLFRYRSSEGAYPAVYVNGRETVRGRFWRRGPGRVRWAGRMRGTPVRPGTYTASIVAADAAGNVSEPSVEVPIRVRYVELVGVPRRARPGTRVRFRVDADARQVLVRIDRGEREGRVRRVRPGMVTVRVPRRPGRFVVVAVAGQHMAEARLRVVR
jgi:flagellar hook capping protein FlgD